MPAFDLLLELGSGAALPETTLEDYVRGNPVLSHPEAFIRGNASLEQHVEIYVRSATTLQAVFADYVKAAALLQRHTEIYVRGEVDFGLRTLERFLKGDSLLARRDNDFIRGDVMFDYHASFILGGATLVRASNLGNFGDNPPSTTKPGVMSRQYLSVVSVKKEVP